MMKTKLGKRQVDNGSQKIRYTPLEDSFHLASMLCIGLGGRRIGAYIQKKGLNSFQVRFGWECKGIHSTLRSEEIDPIFDALEVGLKDLPNNESLTIHLGSFTSDNERQTELANLSKSVPNKELRYLLMGERARVQELTRQGIRKPKFLRLYATYTVEPDTQGTADMIEQFLTRAQRWWKSFTGEIHSVEHTRIERLLYSSFTDGYELWEQLLSNKLGLDVRPLTEEEMWTQLWQRFNDTPPKPIPQLLVLDEEGLREDVYSEVHPTTLLMESASSVPVADREWVNVKGKYMMIVGLS